LKRCFSTNLQQQAGQAEFIHENFSFLAKTTLLCIFAFELAFFISQAAVSWTVVMGGCWGITSANTFSPPLKQLFWGQQITSHSDLSKAKIYIKCINVLKMQKSLSNWRLCLRNIF